MFYISSSISFSAGHFYQQAKWPAEKNQSVFGKCFSPHGHGHDYRLEVQIELLENEKAEETHLELGKSLQALQELLDHKHLNFEIPFFQNMVPTTENIACFCHQQLTQKNPQLKIHNVKLFERPDLFAEIQVL